MCHSVEMYMPKLARDAAGHRLGAADCAAARRERAAVDAAGRILQWLGRLARPVWPVRSTGAEPLSKRCDAGTNG